MADNPYTPPVLTGYNQNPPPDDASKVPENEVSWQTHLDKLTDRLRDFANAINTNVSSAFDKTINTDPDQQNIISGSVALASSSLTLLNDTITPTRSDHVVDTEGGAATDDLATINTTNLAEGAFLFLKSTDPTRVITIQESGNIVTGVGPVIMSPTQSTALRRVGANFSLDTPLPGALIQTVVGETVVTDSNATTTLQASNVSAAITPRYADSIIKISGYFGHQVNSTTVDNIGGVSRLYRDSTGIGIAPAQTRQLVAQPRTADTSLNSLETAAVIDRDTPNTTSAVTYAIWHAAIGAGVTSTITHGKIILEEIKA